MLLAASHPLTDLGPSPHRGGRASTPSFTALRKWIFHAWHTHYTWINPLCTLTLLDWTQFRKQQQNPLGRMEEWQRGLLSKPRELWESDWRPLAPAHEVWARSCWRGGREREAGMQTLYQVLWCSAVCRAQVSEEWPPAKWRGSWEVEVTATEVSSPGGHTAGKTGRVGSLGSPGMGSPRKAVLSLKDFPVVMCFPSYIQC